MKHNDAAISLLIAVAILVVALTGCTSSGVQKISLNIEPQSEILLLVMPFVVAEKRFAVSDDRSQGLVYVYRFADEDYENLRKSIIESLDKKDSFKGVQDASSQSENGAGTSLYVEFAESGMETASWGGFACALKAYAWTEDSTGNVLAKREIAVLEKSQMSVGAAKNRAITEFVREVSRLFATN
jgi:hypothetical protein